MNSVELALVRLREKSGSHLRAIEDLTKFRSKSHFFSVYEDDPKRFAYLLISGHPSTFGKSPTVILGGHVESAAQLIKYLPKSPYTIVETDLEFIEILRG